MAVPRILAIGFAGRDSANSRDVIRSPAAPSLIPEEFPAVTVPFFLKTGFSVASFSMVVSLLGPSSTFTPSARSGVGVGTTSPSNLPSSIALTAFM